MPSIIPPNQQFPRNQRNFSLLSQLLVGLLAVFVYFYGLGSDHIATNGDELLYAQIARSTAQSGHWLPLQSPIAHHQNTKPPLLFWQGIVSTNWATDWSLWNLRWPSVVYTLCTALLLFVLGERIAHQRGVGLLAALIFLSFFGTFRYGRCFLTSAPEVFWLFLPLSLLILWPRSAHLWRIIPFAGFMIGVGLLYKSFALIIPVTVARAWWSLLAHTYDIKKWLRHDAVPLLAIASLALGIFSLWFFLDPHPAAILHDFVIRENLGKFDVGAGNYFWNFFVGNSSIWRNVIAYPLNAGLLAPAVLALFVITFLHKMGLSYHRLFSKLADASKIQGVSGAQIRSVQEKLERARTEATQQFAAAVEVGKSTNEALLWIWIITVFLVFSLPNQRDERYLLLAMPALALLLALHWEHIPQWTLTVSLVAVSVIVGGLAGLALLLEHDLATPIWHFYRYPITYWALLGATMGTALYGLMKSAPTRLLVCPCILLLYFCYGAFLSPFDGPLGQFDQRAREAIRGKTLWVPINFNAREESYRFLFPESSTLLPYDYRASITIEELKAKLPRFIISLPLTDRSCDNLQGVHLLGRRLNLIDRFNAQETQAILRGNIASYLFHQDLLIE